MRDSVGQSFPAGRQVAVSRESTRAAAILRGSFTQAAVTIEQIQRSKNRFAWYHKAVRRALG